MTLWLIAGRDSEKGATCAARVDAEGAHLASRVVVDAFLQADSRLFKAGHRATRGALVDGRQLLAAIL